nr:MAG TPA: hypothetical protein [Caudoviricetes sp.]
MEIRLESFLAVAAFTLIMLCSQYPDFPLMTQL